MNDFIYQHPLLLIGLISVAGLAVLLALLFILSLCEVAARADEQAEALYHSLSGGATNTENDTRRFGKKAATVSPRAAGNSYPR